MHVANRVYISFRGRDGAVIWDLCARNKCQSPKHAERVSQLYMSVAAAVDTHVHGKRGLRHVYILLDCVSLL